jgi:hypothetical protein
MKFIISENKFKNAIYTYLDFTLDSLEYEGNYYFPYKGTDKLIIKVVDERDDGKLKVKISSHIVDDIKSMFTLTDSESIEYIWYWIEHKTNKEVLNMTKTPYTQDLPSFIKR